MDALDVSVYSREIPVEKWRAVKAEGYDLAIVGLFHGRTVNRYAAQQTEAAWEAGMLNAYYVLLAPWTGLSGKEQVRKGIEVSAGVPADTFFAIDCEVDGITEAMIREALEEADRFGAPHICIYTGRWWWVDHFGDSQAFKDIPLWAAQYKPLPDRATNLLDEVKLYGGWTRDKLVGWQYTNTTQFHGINCCKDFFDDAWIADLKEEPMAEFTEKQEKRIRDIIAYERPGLEMAARMAVSTAFEAGAGFAKVGSWRSAQDALAIIEDRMKDWSRWEE